MIVRRSPVCKETNKNESKTVGGSMTQKNSKQFEAGIVVDSQQSYHCHMTNLGHLG